MRPPSVAKASWPRRRTKFRFAGSAAVFFEKEPVETEVLGDADPEIAFAFKALKTLTDDELEVLRQKNWIGRERTFKQLIDARPRSKVEKLYRFLYLSHFSYGKLRGKSFNPNADGVEARTIERIEQHRDRIRAATVRHAHYADLVKEPEQASRSSSRILARASRRRSRRPRRRWPRRWRASRRRCAS